MFHLNPKVGRYRWPESCILKNATPFLLVSLSLSTRCCDVRFLVAFLFFPLLHYCGLILFRASGTCLDLVGETRRVSERTAVLEKASQGTDSLWSNPRRCHAIVLLLDHAQHIGEAIDGCQTSLITMYSIMLPRNPLPRDFR
jgi:hypothetical protein